jgi:hypothetical protein
VEALADGQGVAGVPEIDGKFQFRHSGECRNDALRFHPPCR